jgi:hypothetical protein
VWYDLAADLTAVVHLVFIGFVIFGALLGRRSRWWRTAHFVAMAYGVLIEVFYWYCPLTYLEQYLRERSGRGSFSEPFIAHYLNKIIYLDAPQWSLILAAFAVLGVNAALYIRFPAPSPRKPSTPPDS